MNPSPVNPPVIYECHPTALQSLRKHREDAFEACRQNYRRLVRIQTIDGHLLEGTIVQLDGHHVYLSLHQGVPETRPVPAFGYYPPRPPYGLYPTPAGTILPLVLFELLTIALLA